jgi:hypothetical protein
MAEQAKYGLIHEDNKSPFTTPKTKFLYITEVAYNPDYKKGTLFLQTSAARINNKHY